MDIERIKDLPNWPFSPPARQSLARHVAALIERVDALEERLAAQEAKGRRRQRKPKEE